MNKHKTYLFIIDGSIFATGILLLSALQLFINYGINNEFIDVLLLTIFLFHILVSYWLTFYKKKYMPSYSNIGFSLLILPVIFIVYSMPIYSFHHRLGVNNSIFLGIVLGQISRSMIYLSLIFRNESKVDKSITTRTSSIKRQISNCALRFGYYILVFYILFAAVDCITHSVDASIMPESLGLYSLWN